MIFRPGKNGVWDGDGRWQTLTLLFIFEFLSKETRKFSPLLIRRTHSKFRDMIKSLHMAKSLFRKSNLNFLIFFAYFIWTNILFNWLVVFQKTCFKISFFIFQMALGHFSKQERQTFISQMRPDNDIIWPSSHKETYPWQNSGCFNCIWNLKIVSVKFPTQRNQ